MATEQSLDTVANTRILAVGGEASWAAAQRQVGSAAHMDRMDRYSEVLMTDLLEHRKHVNLLTTTYLGRVCDNASTIDPIEAASTAKLFQGSSDSNMLSLMAQLSAGGVGAKIMDSVPPESPVIAQLAQLNAVTNQNSQNSNSIMNQNLAALNGLTQQNAATNATLVAVAGILAKIFQAVPSSVSGMPAGGAGSVG